MEETIKVEFASFVVRSWKMKRIDGFLDIKTGMDDNFLTNLFKTSRKIYSNIYHTIQKLIIVGEKKKRNVF